MPLDTAPSCTFKQWWHLNQYVSPDSPAFYVVLLSSLYDSFTTLTYLTTLLDYSGVYPISTKAPVWSLKEDVESPRNMGIQFIWRKSHFILPETGLYLASKVIYLCDHLIWLSGSTNENQTVVSCMSTRWLTRAGAFSMHMHHSLILSLVQFLFSFASYSLSCINIKKRTKESVKTEPRIKLNYSIYSSWAGGGIFLGGHKRKSCQKLTPPPPQYFKKIIVS